MLIRKAAVRDLDTIMAVYDSARRFMRENGNLTQWVNGYPSRELVTEDIAAGRSYLCLDEEGEILAAFCFIVGDDPTYHVIREGRWKNDAPYGVIHRLGVCRHRTGAASFCINWCWEQHHNLRIDTHSDNLPMQRCVLRSGFTYCGIITLADGTDRMAYQRTE